MTFFEENDDSLPKVLEEFFNLMGYKNLLISNHRSFPMYYFLTHDYVHEFDTMSKFSFLVQGEYGITDIVEIYISVGKNRNEIYERNKKYKFLCLNNGLFYNMPGDEIELEMLKSMIEEGK